jgi:hypothetical protein
MALTGELEHIHIVDIFQLLNTTRKSGIFSVKGSRGESQLIFSNGCIVGANHLNNRIRIGTVLVKMDAITQRDLEQALDVQKKAGTNRKPLIATLIEMGKLEHDRAFKGLKKLIEMTIVELIGWNKGTFTLETEAIAVSDECRYLPDKMEQEIGLDAQMVLMDALRIFDERERDRKDGKTAASYEEVFAEEISSEEKVKGEDKSMVVTADDLGLADLDSLEEKIPPSTGVKEIYDQELFNPVEIHRQNIRETLDDFSSEEQEMFVSFLEKFTSRARAQKGSEILEGQTNALILFSKDKLIKHSIMTICKSENILVFATDKEEELGTIVDHCLIKKIVPIVVFDSPETSGEGISEDKILTLRQQVKERYPQVSNIQLASSLEYTFTLQSYNEGIKAVIPKPLKEIRRETFIEDTIKFLETFKSYIVSFLHRQEDVVITDNQLGKLRDRLVALRSLSEPPDVTFALLQFVSEIFERSITFIIRSTELIGKEAIGVKFEKTMGPTSVAHIKIPIVKHSIFSDVIEKGQVFFGEIDDEVLKEHLFKEIGKPLYPTIILLPMKSSRKVIAITYGDFGKKEASPVQVEMLEILSNQAGLVLENVLYRKHINKTSQK